MPLSSRQRPLFAGLAIAVAASSLSGCAWLRTEPAYLDSQESRPLELPPDLLLPTSSAALQIPPAPAGSAAPGEAPPASLGLGSAFVLEDSSESAFRRVGLALGRIDGVTATRPVAALNSHEVTFGGSTFLVRLAAESQRVRVDAISPEGTVLTGGAAGELLGLLRARLD